MKLLNEGIEEDLDNFITLANGHFNSFYCVEITYDETTKSSENDERKFFTTKDSALNYYNKLRESLKDKLTDDEYVHIILSKVDVDLNFNELDDEFINMD